MRIGISAQQQHMAHVKERKARNRAANLENLRGEALQLGIPLQERVMQKFAEVQEMRRSGRFDSTQELDRHWRKQRGERVYY